MLVSFHDGAIHAIGQAEIVSIDDQAAHRASLAGTHGNDSRSRRRPGVPPGLHNPRVTSLPLPSPLPIGPFERGGLLPFPWRSWCDAFSSMPARTCLRCCYRLRQTQPAPHSIPITAVVPGRALSSTDQQFLTSSPFL